CWPAISPDGKSVAVARLGHDKDRGDTLQILLHDLNGKTKKQSKVFSIPQAGKESSLFWGPSEDKIVVNVSADQSKMVGIYDVKNDKLKILKDASASVFAGRVARPDGKGFVVTKGKLNAARAYHSSTRMEKKVLSP